MNSIKVTEAEKKEIREAKADVVNLRNKVAATRDTEQRLELDKDLHSARMYCKLLEENILDLPEEEDLDAMMEAAPPRKKVKWLVKVVTVAVLLAIIFWSAGCQTLQGVKGDIHWLTADVEHSKQ